ncbi:MAG: pyrrolysine--tRNA(Pyl) ligase small subunit [Candidatus Methanosuratincola petrocarbonis]
MIEIHQAYPSRNRILHRVKEVKRVGQMLHIFFDCGTSVLVKDSSRSRAARWLNQMIYWTECNDCCFPEKPSNKYPPKEKLKISPEKKYSRRELRLGNFELRRRD